MRTRRSIDAAGWMELRGRFASFHRYVDMQKENDDDNDNYVDDDDDEKQNRIARLRSALVGPQM